MSESPATGVHEPSRRDRVFVVLAGIFVAHALLGELTGGKLIVMAGFTMSIGVIPWPAVFVTTDLVNEYYGPRAVRQLTLLAMGLVAYAFVLLWLCMQVPAADISPVTNASFDMVFGQSMGIIVGSVVAFAASQLLDAVIFVVLRARTSGRMLWLRAVGSTVVSQLIDSFIVTFIAFVVPGKITAAQGLETSLTNYVYKFLIALGTLPVIYAGHGVVDRYLRGTDPPPRVE
ncbi:MAG: queuosine precursor transporter [Myxococcales bacterium]|nr:queuosine precursor transporter [Myxococcales bacterium]